MKTHGRAVACALAVATVAFVAPAWAAGMKLSQIVSHDEVGVEDAFELTIRVSDAARDARLELPRSDDFDVLGTRRSSQVSINSSSSGDERVEQTQQYIVQLRAKRTGTLTIPGAVLTSGGQRLRAEPVSVEVRPGSVLPDTPDVDPNDPFAALGFPSLPRGFSRLFDDEDFFGGDPFAGLRGSRKPSPSDVRLSTSVDKRSVYAGQQVTVSVYLLSRVPLSSVQGFKLPKVEGALVEDLDTPKQLKGEERVIDGVPYTSFLVARRALFPMKPGGLTIGSAEVEVVAGSVFGGQARLTPKSAPLRVDVKPVPPSPRGAEAAVGDWKLEMALADGPRQVGEPITVRVTAQGDGDLSSLELPKLSVPEGLKTFAPTATQKRSPHGGQLGGVRTDEYILIPEQPGEFSLPALEMVFFDPDTGQHRTSNTTPLHFTVSPAPAGAGRTVAKSGTERPVVGPNEAIQPLRSAPVLQPGRRPCRTPLFALLLLVPAAALLASFIFPALRKRRRSERKLREGAARKHLARARRHQERGEAVEFYAEVERGLKAFVASRVPNGTALTRPVLAERLIESGVKREQRDRLLEALDTCEASRFRPDPDLAAMAHALKLARHSVAEGGAR